MAPHTLGCAHCTHSLVHTDPIQLLRPRELQEPYYIHARLFVNIEGILLVRCVLDFICHLVYKFVGRVVNVCSGNCLCELSVEMFRIFGSIA